MSSHSAFQYKLIGFKILHFWRKLRFIYLVSFLHYCVVSPVEHALLLFTIWRRIGYFFCNLTMLFLTSNSLTSEFWSILITTHTQFFNFPRFNQISQLGTIFENFIFLSSFFLFLFNNC